MVVVDDHAGGAQLLVGEQLGGVEHGAARHAELRQAAPSPSILSRCSVQARTTARVSSALRVARRLAREARIVEQVGALDGAQQRLPVLLRRQQDVEVVVRSARRAGVEIARRRGDVGVAGARRGVAGDVGRRHGVAHQVDDRILQRHLDAAAAPGAVRRSSAARMPTARCRPVPLSAMVTPSRVGGPSAFAGDAHRAADRLGDEVERLVLRPRPARPIAAHRGDDQPRQLRAAAPRSAKPRRSSVAGAKFSASTSAVRSSARRCCALVVRRQVEHDAALALIEQHEDDAVARGVAADQVAARLAARRLDLDDVGAQPGEDLRRRRPGLVLGEIDDAHAGEGRRASGQGSGGGWLGAVGGAASL